MALRGTVSSNSGNSGTMSVAVPAGAAIDDIAVIMGSIDSTSASVDFATAVAAIGFTSLDVATMGPDGQKSFVAWKRLSAADAGSYSITPGASANWQMQAALFSGRDTGNPPVIGTVFNETASQSPPFSTTINGVTALAGDDLFAIVILDPSGSVTDASHTPPTGYTETSDVMSTFNSIATSLLANASAGATGNLSSDVAASAGSAGYATWLLRIPEAPAGGGSSIAAIAAYYRMLGTS